MKHLGLIFVLSLGLQSCVKEIPTPQGNPSNWENQYLITGDTAFCHLLFDQFLTYYNIDNVDSIQWHPSENLWHQLLADTLRIREIESIGDTAYISLLIFENSDTSEISITVYDCFQTIYIPNGFTPDGDHLNDEWFPIYTNIQEMNWTIHSDDGKLVFDNEGDLNARWDGTWNGNPAPEGLYRYWIQYLKISDGKTETKEDWLQLYRNQ